MSVVHSVGVDCSFDILFSYLNPAFDATGLGSSAKMP